MYSSTLITPPIVEPISLDAAKNFCAISNSFTDDDVMINGLITAGRQTAENYTQRAFFDQTWMLTLDHFPLYWGYGPLKNISDSFFPYEQFFQGMMILLPRPRAISITSLTYYDTSGNQQTMPSEDYYLDPNSEPGRLMPAAQTYWPAVSVYMPGGVQVTYEAGTYGDGVVTNNIPQNVVTAIGVFVAHFYQNREGNVEPPNAFYRLLDPIRYVGFTQTYY